MAEGKPLTADQQLVMQTVYDRFRSTGTWPPFISVDRPLRRQHGIDVGGIVLSIPSSLLISSRAGGIRPIETDQLRLRLAGVALCQGGSEDADRFLRLLRWFAERELDADVECDSGDIQVRVTSAEVQDYLGLDMDDGSALARIYSILQQENWGWNGGGTTSEGWFVNLGSDVWRFRDVKSIQDFLAVHEAWRRESPLYQAAQKSAEAYERTQEGQEKPVSYYHVRVSTKSNRTWDEVALDLSPDRLESQFLVPYREGRPIVVNGSVVQIDNLAKIRINKTDIPAEQVRVIVRDERRSRRVVAALPENWLVADWGPEVTDEFITEPPGSQIPLRGNRSQLRSFGNGADRVGVVFVHGFLSSSKAWEPFQQLISQDPDLSRVEPLFFAYSSPKINLSKLRQIPTYDDVADSLRVYLEVEAKRFRCLVLVAHSQGGLIVQRYLNWMTSEGRASELQRIRQIILFACPNSGSEIALSLRRRWMPRNPQEEQLRPLNRAVADTQRAVLTRIVHAREVTSHSCPIPVTAYAGESDNVVTPASAQSVFPDAGVLPGDHSQIIRPNGTEHRSYTTLKSKLLNVLNECPQN